MQNTFLLNSTVITGGKEGTTTAEPATTNAETQVPAETSGSTNTLSGGMGGFSIILIYGAILVAMYYFTIRPARKREKLLQTKQNEIKVGDEVVTTSGMHGKVVDIGSDTFNVEFGSNKSVIIPVSKKDVLPSNVDLSAKSAKVAKTEESK